MKKKKKKKEKKMKKQCYLILHPSDDLLCSRDGWSLWISPCFKAGAVFFGSTVDVSVFPLTTPAQAAEQCDEQKCTSHWDNHTHPQLTSSAKSFIQHKTL